MTPYEIYEFFKVTKTDIIINSALACFSLVVVILLMQWQETASTNDAKRSEMKQGTMFIFSTALFANILAFLLFAIQAVETHHSQRAFTLKMSGDFLFMMSAMLVIYGMTWMVRIFDSHSVIAGLTNKLLYIFMLIALFGYASTTNDVISVMYQKSRTAIFREANLLMPLLNALLLCPAIAILKRFLAPRHQVKILSPGFHLFIIIHLVIFVMVSLMPTLIIYLSPDVFVPFWLIILFVILFSFLIAGIILFVPTSSIEC